MFFPLFPHFILPPQATNQPPHSTQEERKYGGKGEKDGEEREGEGEGEGKRERERERGKRRGREEILPVRREGTVAA